MDLRGSQRREKTALVALIAASNNDARQESKADGRSQTIAKGRARFAERHSFQHITSRSAAAINASELIENNGWLNGCQNTISNTRQAEKGVHKPKKMPGSANAKCAACRLSEEAQRSIALERVLLLPGNVAFSHGTGQIRQKLHGTEVDNGRTHQASGMPLACVGFSLG